MRFAKGITSIRRTRRSTSAAGDCHVYVPTQRPTHLPPLEARESVCTTNAIARRFRDLGCHARAIGTLEDRTSRERILFAVAEDLATPSPRHKLFDVIPHRALAGC
jgi:hypothetical protein